MSRSMNPWATAAARYSLSAVLVSLIAACGGGGGSSSEPAGPPQVTMTVSNGAGTSGTMLLTLDPDKAPITVANFLRYVNDGFYNETVFHRVVISGTAPIAIQGGGARMPGATPKGVFPPIALEVNKGLSNVRWSIAMARASFQANSATSGFFINTADNSSGWDPHAPTSAGDDGLGYAVFGTVTAGTDVVAAMTSAPCQPITNVTVAPDCTPIPVFLVTSMVRTR